MLSLVNRTLVLLLLVGSLALACELEIARYYDSVTLENVYDGPNGWVNERGYPIDEEKVVLAF